MDVTTIPMPDRKCLYRDQVYAEVDTSLPRLPSYLKFTTDFQVNSHTRFLNTEICIVWHAARLVTCSWVSIVRVCPRKDLDRVMVVCVDVGKRARTKHCLAIPCVHATKAWC
jgi:hypothetical protein